MSCNSDLLLGVHLTPDSVRIELFDIESLKYINYNFNEHLKLKIKSNILTMVWNNMLRDKHELCWRNMRRDTDLD